MARHHQPDPALSAPPDITVPDTVRATARRRGAEHWVEEVPGLVADLSARWTLTVGEVLPGGTESVVVGVTTVDGRAAVLKLLVPDEWWHELTVLRLADGHGCVQLFEADADRGAMLLERLGPTLDSHGLPLRERNDLLVDTAAALWRPAVGHGLPTGREKAEWLAVRAVEWWEATDRPCHERTITAVVAAAERRAAAHDDCTAVLVHGDVHQWNTLRAADGWRLVDPDGLLAEPACDLGVILRENPDEFATVSDVIEEAHRLASRSGVDVEAALDWGTVERVANGLLWFLDDDPDTGRPFLDLADRLARHGG